ncbi:hypothetical protein OG225_41010 (plasmid) [Nocardia sp. NBC_01377]|uniref:DUF6603 domain-containing protein n=1 Tax=Nocardia sp. NBC_01377 TaxID=2903595 RepID=UPI002F90C33F
MNGADLVAFVDDLRDRLAAAAGESVDLTADLNALVTDAEQVAGLLSKPTGTVPEAKWRAAVTKFEQSRSRVLEFLTRATAGALADTPVFKDVLGNAEEIARTGLRVSFDLGPVHVAASSGVLYLDPPKLEGDVVMPPVPIGPFPLGAVNATIASPFGGNGPSMPGGGVLVRLAHPDGSEKGWGGRIEVPLPPVQVSAAAILAVDGTVPSFLAVLGIEFVPPIQLSFGFSLDRVGGIIGVNRTMWVDELRAAIRTGAAADALFQVRPPSDPAVFATTLDRLFPRSNGSHLVGPSLKLSWLSFGQQGSLVALDVAVIVEVPVGRVAILGSARIAIPNLPAVLNLRLDLLGLFDPVEQLVSIDASLVDSHILGIFEVYGDAALRLSWGSQPYVVISVGGFFPGFDPKPAKLPPIRRVGMSQSVPGGVIALRVEGYFAVTGNSLQMGGRIEAGIDFVIKAHGFIEVDALIQFRPFRFQARIAAGFSVSVEGFQFGSVHLSGQVSGPGPIVIQGSLSISVFLFEISWDQTFTLGSGPADALPPSRPLLDILAEELGKKEALRAASTSDPHVVLAPRPPATGFALVPPTGTLQAVQRAAPLGIPLDRVHGLPLDGKQGARIAGSGNDVLDGFAPASFLNLTDAESLNRKPFEDLPAGKVLTPADPLLTDFPSVAEIRKIHQIVIDTRTGATLEGKKAAIVDLARLATMVVAARAEPALSDPTPVLSAVREQWVEVGTGTMHQSATAAHEFARGSTVAVAAADLAEPVDLTGVM